MNKIKETLKRVVASLKESENVCAISLIGSGALNYQDMKNIKDVDLLILVEEDDHQSREVRFIDSIEFDFTYLSRSTLQASLDEKQHIWLNLLSKAKHLYKKTKQIEEMFKLTNLTYADGPAALTQDELKFIRFNLTKKLEDLERRIDKVLVFQYLAGIFLKSVTEAYFKLQNTWIPRDKRMMEVLFERDILLYELVKATFKAQETEEHYKLIKDILNYVLKPYGGMLTTLDRQTFEMED